MPATHLHLHSHLFATYFTSYSFGFYCFQPIRIYVVYLLNVIFQWCCIFVICLINTVEVPGMRNSGVSVNMTVSSQGIKLTSIENGMIIANHDMQGISFASGGEKVYCKPFSTVPA